MTDPAAVSPRLPLRTFLARHMLAIRLLHDDGECAGIRCPYCEYERQWPGKPYYLTLPVDEAPK